MDAAGRRAVAVAVAALATALTAGCLVVELPADGDATFTATVPPTAAPPASPDGDVPPAEDAPEPSEVEEPLGDVVAAIEERVFARANEARQAEGVGPLERHEGLDAVARAWSLHLADGGRQLAHNPDFSQQMPSGWTAAGENVGWIDEGGRLDPEQVADRVHDGWMDSPGHRENLLRPDYTHLGVGVAHDPDHGYYLTQNFARY